MACGPVNETEVPNDVPYVVLAMVESKGRVEMYEDGSASLDCLGWSCEPNPESCAYSGLEVEDETAEQALFFGSGDTCHSDAPTRLCRCSGGRLISGRLGLVLPLHDPVLGNAAFQGAIARDGWVEITRTWEVEVSSTAYIVHHAGGFELELADGARLRSGLFYPVREK